MSLKMHVLAGPVLELQLAAGCSDASLYRTGLALPWRDCVFWLTSAMIAAKAGEETEVPPIPESPKKGAFGSHVAPKSISQSATDAPRNPGLANNETSGRSRFPSAGTPSPLCQDGLAYPPWQL